MAKNIVLCSDGTGNRDIKNRGSNVFKLYEAVDIQSHREDPSLMPQIGFYDDGVGTNPSLRDRLLGNAFGWGFSRNVRRLYTMLVHAYHPPMDDQEGDKIFLFGFSRGAYTVRALSGMIQYCGVLDVHNFVRKEDLEKAVAHCWKVFKKEAFGHADPLPMGDPEGPERRRRLGAVCPERPVSIEFIGVWDTVGAVGLPFRELTKKLPFIPWFADQRPGPYVKMARQALSIDDERKTFHPELWEERGAEDGTIQQVWFAGVHSNVGGGYPKQGLSLVTLDWMMTEAELCGLRFVPEDRRYVGLHQDVHDKLYDSRAGIALYYRWAPRNLASLCFGHCALRVHESALERIAYGTEGYSPGNLPFAFQIITTNTTPIAASRLAALNPVLQAPPWGALPGSPLDSCRHLVLMGQCSYWLLWLLPLFALAAACRVGILPSRIPIIARSHGSLALIAGSVAVGLWFLKFIADTTDRKMDARFSLRWHAIRKHMFDCFN